jgi:hypothetical protein
MGRGSTLKVTMQSCRSNINPTLHIAHIELYRISQERFVVQRSILQNIALIKISFCSELVPYDQYLRAAIAQWVQRLGYGLDDRSSIPVGDNNRNFSRHSVQTGSGIHSASCPLGTWVKRPGREVDHSSPYSTEVKNAWSCTSSPNMS